MNPLSSSLEPTVGRTARVLWTLLLCLLLAATAGCGSGNRFVFSSSSEIVARPDHQGMPYHEVIFPASDGVKLHGWYVSGAPEMPVVLFFHGNAANISHRIENLLFFNRLGLPVFIFDYRGFGRSQGEPTGEDDLYRDARAALEYLRSIGYSPSETVYYGRSMGAAVALQMALEAPPARLVLECAFTDLRGIAWHMTPFTYATVGWWGLQNEFRNIDKISRLAVPLLLIHGERDRIVPVEMGRRLFAKAPPPKQLLIVPGAGHSNAHAVGGQSYRRAWLDFIAPPAPRKAWLDKN